MTTRLTSGIVFDGPYELISDAKNKIENELTAMGCRVIFSKTVPKPRRIILVEDGPAVQKDGSQEGGRF